jgi:hypothetical protein
LHDKETPNDVGMEGQRVRKPRARLLYTLNCG